MTNLIPLMPSMRPLVEIAILFTSRKQGECLAFALKNISQKWRKSATRAGRKESLKNTYKSAITDHVADKNHVIGWKQAKVIGTEEDRYKRWIKEAIEIRKRRGKTMNRDDGQYHFTHIFDEFLVPTETRSPIGKQTCNKLLLQIVASPETNASHSSSVGKDGSLR